MRRKRAKLIRKSLSVHEKNVLQSQDELFFELSVIYLLSFPNQWSDADDILIFKNILKEDYNIDVDEEELLFTFITLSEEMMGYELE